MWIFSQHSFLSIVKHDSEPGMMMVRSRFPGHIEDAFPDAAVKTTPEADYSFRATIPATAVSAWIARAAREIDYPNFKGSIQKPKYAQACGIVWSALYRITDQLFPRSRIRGIAPEKRQKKHLAIG